MRTNYYATSIDEAPPVFETKKSVIKINKKSIKYGRADSIDPINCNYYLFMWYSVSNTGFGTPVTQFLTDSIITSRDTTPLEVPTNLF